MRQQSAAELTQALQERRVYCRRVRRWPATAAVRRRAWLAAWGATLLAAAAGWGTWRLGTAPATPASWRVGVWVAGLAVATIALTPLGWRVWRGASTRRYVRRSHAAFRAGGVIVEQFDLDLVAPPLSATARTASGVALVGRPGQATDDLARVARHLARGARGGKDLPFARWERGLSAKWSPPRSVTDKQGHRLAPLHPGRFVVLLPDGEVLGIAGQAQAAASVASSSGPPPGSAPYVLHRGRPERLAHGALAAAALVIAAVFGGMAWRYRTAVPWVGYLTGALLAGTFLLIAWQVATANLGRTVLDASGVHTYRLGFLPRHLPWTRVRGFVPVHRYTLHPGRRTVAARLAVVDDDWRLRLLAGFERDAPRCGWHPEAVRQCRELQRFRDSGNLD
ncbi:hypothetical protein [Buchananella hordeovulneris]|uniref:PH domain-containing protein n=1 Tax=Buchananella hordeovulneris TaxID=52770 RepID=A0A1Q5PXJ4_9ACTO|nr:hypothetical protein [Buchananella hordeovulneris]OKL52338.1 hypothetical protein BSZ40_02315 [Buchananella hordeovulneris]